MGSQSFGWSSYFSSFSWPSCWSQAIDNGFRTTKMQYVWKWYGDVVCPLKNHNIGICLWSFRLIEFSNPPWFYICPALESNVRTRFTHIAHRFTHLYLHPYPGRRGSIEIIRVAEKAPSSANDKEKNMERQMLAEVLSDSPSLACDWASIEWSLKELKLLNATNTPVYCVDLGLQEERER